MPEVMAVISSLKADTYINLFYCVLIAAFITAMIHSSSATIGIVMGLGAAGILDWKTAVAFSLGADLGTTITSWMASLNLSKNAKRAAYAHITFNVAGVAVMLPLFFVSMDLLTYVMGWFGGDPGVPVIKDGKETYPLVPVAVGLYSTAFNIFNTVLMFPLVGMFERVLTRIVPDSEALQEDYTQPRFLDPRHQNNLALAVPLVDQELDRYVDGVAKFMDIAKGEKNAPDDAQEHYAATDVLSREIRSYLSTMLDGDLPYARADLVASMIEEADFSASLGEALYQTARRVERMEFSPQGRELVNAIVDQISAAMKPITSHDLTASPVAQAVAGQLSTIGQLRERSLRMGNTLPAADRGAVIALLGTAERAILLIERIDSERRSVPRVVPADEPAANRSVGGMAAVVPAE
jgi:phosphate:Na+ symporter